ncbi:PTS fructose transporter subunit IIA [Streptomyces sp. I05A-00742]|uniref:PTS-dependent dihydroxyacetone kinase phosphotransferase subunit DhaM n=1 Tax=Streptomyces sp. I05A-00742 TaxID=2732853 RepID=UPI0028965E6A|nr:PTS fructose transporter subunit IIA [Streptomyces sp. I05A-00742]
MTALYEATDPERTGGAPQEAPQAPPEDTPTKAPAQAPVETPAQAALEAQPPTAPGRVGVVLVSHSRDLAAATAGLATALVGGGDPAPVAVAGGLPDGGIGTSAELVRAAVAEAGQGAGVVVLCDMGSAVLTVKSLLGGGELTEAQLVDAPFVEGAVAAVVTASAGGDLAAVLAATEDARTYRKV